MNKTTKLVVLAAVILALGAGVYVMTRDPSQTDVATDAAAPEPAPTDQEDAAAHGEAATDAAAPARPSISVAPAALAVLTDRVRASGLVGAVERVIVQPQVEGQAIEAILAEVGDHVTEGQVLARLSNAALTLQRTQLVASLASAEALIAQAEAQLIDANAAADEAKRNWDRADQLRKQGNASQAAADQAFAAAASANAKVMVATQGAAAAKAQLELVKAQIANVELQLARTDIKAPFAGEVVTKNATVGSIGSAAGDPMFVIVRDGLLELGADIAEQDLARIASGMRAALRVAGSDAEITGTVRLVEPAIDPVTRLGRARITIDQEDLIRTGMFLEAAILISEREVIAVPITALGDDEDGTFVMTVDKDGLVHRNAVKTGIRDSGKVEIVEGVEAGALVVAKAASFVRDGDMVDPVPLDGTAATN